MDRVQVLKQESSDLGGDNADAVEYPTPIEPQEDALEAAGLYLQDATHRDELVQVWRAGDDMMFKDPRVGLSYSLEQLISSPSVPPNFSQASDEEPTSTTSTLFAPKASLTLLGLPAGTYYIVFYIEGTCGNTNRAWEFQLQVDGVSYAEVQDQTPTANQYLPFSGFVLATLTAGNHTVSLQYRIVTNGTVTARRARIGFWRAA